MDIQYLSSDDWKAFERLYPDAFRFLLHASLQREQRYLRIQVNNGPANDMRRARLQELDVLFTTQEV